MKAKVCLEHASDTRRFADDCDCSSFVGHPVRSGGDVVGAVVRAWVNDGSLYAELDITDESLREFLSGTQAP